MRWEIPSAATTSRSGYGGELLAEIKYKVLGCLAAAATCSMMGELATGNTVAEAYELDDVVIRHDLGGLPEAKQHCSNHAVAALTQP